MGPMASGVKWKVLCASRSLWLSQDGAAADPGPMSLTSPRSGQCSGAGPARGGTSEGQGVTVRKRGSWGWSCSGLR